jgi:hypothetical protein
MIGGVQSSTYEELCPVRYSVVKLVEGQENQVTITFRDKEQRINHFETKNLRRYILPKSLLTFSGYRWWNTPSRANIWPNSNMLLLIDKSERPGLWKELHVNMGPVIMTERPRHRSASGMFCPALKGRVGWHELGETSSRDPRQLKK